MVSKENIISVVSVFLFAILFYGMAIGLHEVIHLSVLRALGGDGHLIFSWYYVFIVYDQFPVPVYGDMLVAFSGGVGIGILFLLLALLNFDDAEEQAALIPLAIMQLTYGIFEGLFIRTMSLYDYCYLGQIIGFGALAFGTIPSMYIMYKKFMKERT